MPIPSTNIAQLLKSDLMTSETMIDCNENDDDIIEQQPFRPRIINPVKLNKVYVFSAEEELREAEKTLAIVMPWVETVILTNPMAVSNLSIDEPFVLLMDDTSAHFVQFEQVRKSCKNIVFILLSYNRIIQCSPTSMSIKEFPYIQWMDLVFAVDRNVFKPHRIVTSAIRCAEDLLNIKSYSQAKRYIFLIVDDEPRWSSQFLPVLYDIIGQRADVKITQTYEETLQFMFGVDHENDISSNFLDKGRGDDVVCLITDVFFPRNNNLTSDSGKDLIRLARKYYPRIPIIIASKTKEAEALRNEGYVLPKGNPGSLEALKKYIHDFCGIGNFLVHDAEGTEIFRLTNLREILGLLYQVKDQRGDYQQILEILNEYGEKDFFSTWLYMHSYRDLGDRLRPLKGMGDEMIDILINLMENELKRIKKRPLVINNKKIFNLPELVKALKSASPEEVQPLSNNDVLSSWLDRKCFSELAEELRPIHGKGKPLVDEIIRVVDKWISFYEQREETYRIAGI